jgi:predicted kinase
MAGNKEQIIANAKAELAKHKPGSTEYIQIEAEIASLLAMDESEFDMNAAQGNLERVNKNKPKEIIINWKFNNTAEGKWFSKVHRMQKEGNDGLGVFDKNGNPVFEDAQETIVRTINVPADIREKYDPRVIEAVDSDGNLENAVEFFIGSDDKGGGIQTFKNTPEQNKKINHATSGAQTLYQKQIQELAELYKSIKNFDHNKITTLQTNNKYVETYATDMNGNQIMTGSTPVANSNSGKKLYKPKTNIGGKKERDLYHNEFITLEYQYQELKDNMRESKATSGYHEEYTAILNQFKKSNPNEKIDYNYLHQQALEALRVKLGALSSKAAIENLIEGEQGILQFGTTDMQQTNVKDINKERLQLEKNVRVNVKLQNELLEKLKAGDITIKQFEDQFTSIDSSKEEQGITYIDQQMKDLGDKVTATMSALDAKIADLGDINEYSFSFKKDLYNRLIEEKNYQAYVYESEFKELGDKRTIAYNKWDVINDGRNEIYDNYTIALDNRKLSYQQYLNTSTKIVEFGDQDQHFLEYLNTMSRNGHNVVAAGAWIGTSLLGIAGGIEGAIDAIQEVPEDILFSLFGNDPEKMPTLIQVLHSYDTKKDNSRLGRVQKWNGLIERINNSVQAPQEYDELGKGKGLFGTISDYAAFGLHATANFLPQLLVIAATGPYSLYILGASSGGQKRNEMLVSNKLGLTNYSMGQIYTSTLIAFGAEVLTEKFTLGVYDSKIHKLGTGTTKRIATTFSARLNVAYKNLTSDIPGNIYNTLGEGTSEWFAEFSNNVGDRYVLGQNISLLKGTGAAFLTGAFMNQTMSFPGIYKDLSNIFVGADYKQKIYTLNKSTVKLSEKLSLASSPEEIKLIEAQILSNTEKAAKILVENTENIDLMSNEHKDLLVEIDGNLVELDAREDDIDDIDSDDNMTSTTRENLKEEIANERNDLLNQKNDIMVKYETPEQKKIKQDKFESQLKAIKRKVAADNKRRIKSFTETNDAGRGNVVEFKTAEEQQVFFNEQIAEENAILEAEMQGWEDILSDPTNLNKEDTKGIGLEPGGQLMDYHVNQIKQKIVSLQKKINTNNSNSAINANSYGAFTAKPEGGYTIYINEENSLKTGGRWSTAAHEFLHAILFKSLNQDSETQSSLGLAVADYINKNKDGFSQQFVRRMEAYGGTKEFGEEIITIMSESIMDGTLQFNDNLFVKLGDIIRQHLQRIGLLDITFNNGKDVYNFIKDYNASIEQNYDSKAIVEMMDNGAAGALLRKPTTTKVDRKPVIMNSKEASDKVQKIYDEQGLDGAWDIIKEFSPIVGKIVQKRSQAPGFDAKLLTDEINTGERGLYDLIADYDPSLGVPLAAYINTHINLRAIEASRRVLVEQFTDDVSTIGELMDEAGETDVTVTTDKPVVQTLVAGRLGVGNKVARVIKKIVPTLNIDGLSFKTLKDQTPEITGKLFGIDPKKLTSGANISKKELQTAQIFINKHADLFISMLPQGSTASGTSTGVPNTLLGPFYTKVDRASMAKTGSKAGLPIQVKNSNISKKQFLEVFGIIDGKPVRDDRNTSARVLALANLTGKMMTNQAVRQELVNRGKPLKAFSHIADGKSTFMFSAANGKRVNVGAIDKSLSPTAKIEFWDGIATDFVNKDVLDRNLKSIKLNLKAVFGKKGKNSPEIMLKIDELAEGLHTTISRLSEKIINNPVKLNDKLLQKNAAAEKKVKEFWRSDTTSKDAFRDKDRVSTFRATTTLFANSIFDPNNIEMSLGKILMLRGHLASSSKNSYLDRGQLFPDTIEFLKATIESIQVLDSDGRVIDDAIVVYTNTSKDGKTNIQAITYMGVELNMPSITSSQASESALKDTKDPAKLDKRSYNEDIAIELLDEYTDFYVDLYKRGEIDNVDMQMVSTALLSNMDSFLARAAKLKYIADNIYDFQNPGKEVKFEHMIPRTPTLLGIWDAKLNSEQKINIKDLLKNYTVQIIPNSMDDVLTEAGLSSALFEGQKITDPSWIRTFNEKTRKLSNGRLRTLIDVYTKKSLTPTNAFVKGANIIKAGLIEGEAMSKAHMLSKPVNPAKGISVFDLDDTLAITKSGVRYTLPNPSGIPQPKKKVIFMAGGPGSGKSNVIKQLGLKGQGFKVVNQDISLEWLMKNHGMPTDMREFTPEQASEFGKLSHEARGIALKKRIKYQGEGDGVIIDGTGASLNVMKKNIQDFKDKGYDVQMIFVETSQETALSRNKTRKERSLRTGIVIKTHDSVQANKEAYKELFGERFAEVNTDNLEQGDAMPIDVVTKVNDFTSGYIKGRLNAGEYSVQGEELKQQGAKFDFSEFNKIIDGKTAPLFEKALKLQDKFGNKDMFILTARPIESAQAIFEFLQANGLNIPMENIVGLGSSASADKALWIAGKVGEGYNDFYFADDILENVQAVSDMLAQFDVKSKVQQAKRDFVFGDPVVTKIIDNRSMNNIKNAEDLSSPGVFDNIQFSKAHRAEYENTVAKNRPDLSGKEVTATIDKMFEYIDGLNVPNKRKYERITTKWLATSNIKLPEDSYKIQQAVEIAELKNEDIFSYKNPNEIIEKYAGTIKVKPIDPDGVKELTRSTGFYDPITKYGIVEYEIDDTKEGQQKLRDIVNTHWGPNSNPWCITQIDDDGNLTDDSWRMWQTYRKENKKVVFQNGRLLTTRADFQYWDRMDKATEGPVIQVKEGGVTNRTELINEGGEINPVIRETRTVSEDGNTVTTNIFENSKDGYYEGTTLVENRIKGVKTKETRFDPDGSKVNTQEFNKKGKPTTSYQFNPNGKVKSINGHLQQQAITEAGLDVNAREDADIDLTNELVVKVGDIIENNYTEAETDYFHGRVLVGDQVMEIGFESKTGLDLADVTKTVDGKTRLDIGKILREVDPDVKGLPKTGIMFSKGISKEFNDIIEQSTGVGSEKVFSDAQAKIRGNKMRFDNIVPYSVQDLMGLLYNFVGKGKAGEQHMEFFKKALIDPFARAINELNHAKQAAANDYNNLLKAFPEVKKILAKNIEGSDYTYDQAVRVYLWDKAGLEIPGLSKRDLKMLSDVIKNNPELQAFADAIGLISKKEEGYSKPGEYWLVENIASDLLSDGSIGDARSEFLVEWQQNADEMFSKENLNKIQAIYGSKFREALEDILYRMKHGTNRPTGSNRLTNSFLNWVNNSTGAIMFFNMRSALLQTLSSTNYINWTDNNPLKAAMAFANQKQYWSDFAALFNSDFLKQRRSGNQRSINEAELSAAVANSDNKAKAALAWLLQKGFLPTQIMDSFAISLGGATFYRNRINKYIKEGMTKEEAQEKAFLDFQEITEATQQSARPDMISQQQASPLGRLILSFQNTPMQYARIMNKAARDLAAGRGDPKENISKIIYYGFLQSAIFAALQTAIFAALGDDEEEEFDKKKERIIDSMIDGWLAGLGVAGKAISTIDRSVKEYLEQENKGFNADHAQTIISILGFSPPIGSKLRKIYSGIQTEQYNEGVGEKRGLTLDNPAWSMWGNIIEGATNIPLGRIANKMLNIDNAMNSNLEAWERVALLLGWNTWDLGIKDPDIAIAKEEVKEEKIINKEIIKKEKKIEKKEEQKLEQESIIKENQEKSKEDGICSAISKGGERCKSEAVNGGFCTVHEVSKQNKSGKESQCQKIKGNGERCKVNTANESGYCYYHD